MDRTYHAWQALRELDPTPRRRRARLRGLMFGLLCAATFGYLLAVAGLWAIVFLLVIVVTTKGMK